MTCKICNSQTTKVFSKVILKKYTADYFKCSTCNFMQTSEPVWLQEAYNSAITSLDIGLIDRNTVLKEETSALIDAGFPQATTFLDYAGGYGMFVRMMRDAGYNFFREDIYCENLFAKYFDVTEVTLKTFDIATAFEVFEHFSDPMNEIAKIFNYSDTIVFSTKLLPKDMAEIENWWYLSTETGQHIAFYDSETLKYIAKKFNKAYYFNSKNLHAFVPLTATSKSIEAAFSGESPKRSFFRKQNNITKIQRTSLLQQDYKYIQSLIDPK